MPKKPTLVVADDLNVSYAPQMISREMYHRDAQPTVFSARMKGNGSLTPEYGGAVRIINFVHSFYKYLPPEKYFDAHPDWYSEIDGKRKHEHAQLCLTNEEMTQELIKNVLETLRKNPDAKMIDVSQNDWHGFCTCEKCKAIDDAEESHAGTLVLMLNKVAEAVEKEFPDVLVESLAYQYTRKPPKTIKPRDNVLIRLCTIECSYIQPLDGEQNRKFAADMEGWSKLAKYLFIWDYTTNYNDYLGPHPNLRVLAPNVRYFVKHGAIGLFEEGEGDDFCELKNWLLMRVMWEPNLDAEKLIDEFVRGYYGEAVAPLIKQYWDVLIAQAEKEKIYLGCFGMNSAKWIDLATLNQVTEIMNKAVETATKVYGPDSDELRRLRKSKMGVDHVWLSRYYPLRCESREKKLPFLGPKDPLKAAEEFAELCKRFKTKRRGDFAGREFRTVPGRSEGGIPRAEESAGDLQGRPGRRLGRFRRPVVQQLPATRRRSSTTRKAGTARASAWERRWTGIPAIPRRFAGSTACSPRCAAKEPSRKANSARGASTTRRARNRSRAWLSTRRISRPKTARSTRSSAGLIWALSTSSPARTSGSPTDTIPSWTRSSSTASCSSKRSNSILGRMDGATGAA